MTSLIAYQRPFSSEIISLSPKEAFARMSELCRALETDPDAGAEESVELADITKAMIQAHALCLPDPAPRDLLRALREECRDWQHALSGERPDLDELCASVDAVLA